MRSSLFLAAAAIIAFVLAADVPAADDMAADLAALQKVIPPGAASLAVNGDMEQNTAWKFEISSPGSSYGDGGYVADKALSGKRSYKIIHPPVADKKPWGDGKTTEWAQISQQIAVEPGQRYLVTFGLFNNYGGSVGYLQHQVHIDGKKMWFIDASKPVGWKARHFYFVPTAPKITLQLRTADTKWTGGWNDRGNAWWDNVGLYKAPAK